MQPCCDMLPLLLQFTVQVQAFVTTVYVWFSLIVTAKQRKCLYEVTFTVSVRTGLALGSLVQKS